MNSSVKPSNAPEESASAGQCWICGSERSVPWKSRSFERPLQPEDLRITDSHYGATLALRRCSECGFIFAAAGEVQSLLRLYEQLNDPDYVASEDTRVLQMRWLLARIRKERPAARSLLDIGAGTGLLVREARSLGFEAVGVEPSRSLVEAAIKNRQVELLQGTFPHLRLAGRTFDVITLVDVIEHVSDPVGLLRSCAAALAADGIVLVVTPDVRSLAARLLGKRWWHFRVAHVGYFSRNSLDALAAAAGLRSLRRFRAQWFFRVEYLAERLAHYLPLGAVNRRSRRPGMLGRLYQRIVPVNLHDSTAIIFAKIL